MGPEPDSNKLEAGCGGAAETRSPEKKKKCDVGGSPFRGRGSYDVGVEDEGRPRPYFGLAESARERAKTVVWREEAKGRSLLGNMAQR